MNMTLSCLSLPSVMSRIRSGIQIWKTALFLSWSLRIKKVGRELNVFIKIVEVEWNWSLIVLQFGRLELEQSNSIRYLWNIVKLSDRAWKMQFRFNSPNEFSPFVSLWKLDRFVLINARAFGSISERARLCIILVKICYLWMLNCVCELVLWSLIWKKCSSEKSISSFLFK